MKTMRYFIRFTKQPENEEHNALNDARWTRAAWVELTQSLSGVAG